jgi:hypothetical protein
MPTRCLFYICPICFQVYDTGGTCHNHTMIACTMEPGQEQCRPIAGSRGHLVSRAPRWFLEAVGWVRARPAGTSIETR